MDDKEKLSLAGKQFGAMLQRDFLWVVCCFVLLILLGVMALRAADKENDCDKRYESFVISCYESHGLLPTGPGFNFSWNVSIADRSTGDRWLETNK